MVPETPPAEPAEPVTDDDGASTMVNALLGAVAGIVLSFVPLSTLLGGAVAGYLEGENTSDGLRVGAIAGVMMLVPFFLFGFFMLFFLGVGMGGGAPVMGMMLVVMLVFGALYTVGLSAVGGYLGSYLKSEL